jgi:hypothetical protein
MPDNLNVSIGVDTAKLRADLEVLKAQFKSATADMKKMADEAAKTGDMTRVQKAAKDVDTLSRAIAADTRLLREQTAALRGVGVAASGASHGLQAAAIASHEMAEAHRGTSREVFTLSKDLGKLEISGIGVAKAFREIPKVAGPLAVAVGTTEALLKFANAGYKNVTALDDLSKATGFTGREIEAFKKIAQGADVTVEELNKTLRSAGKSFDEAKIKGGDFGSMLSGVQTMRGGVGTAGTGIPVYRGGAPLGPDGQPLSTIDRSGIAVMRGGAGFNIRPSEGFAGIVDPSQFRTATEFFKTVQTTLLAINRTSPTLARGIIQGQGLDVGATLRLAQGTTPEAFAKAMEEAGGEPTQRPGALAKSRAFGAKQEALGAETEKSLTAAGLLDMDAIGKALEFLQGQFKSITDTLNAFSVSWADGLKHIASVFTTETATVGADLANSFSSAMSGAFQGVASGYDKLRNYMLSNPLPVPSTGSQEGQVIPIPQASGGLIPGLGRGDTVPAMLTPGEFVNRRASVDYYGAGIFSALNNRAIPRGLFSRFGFAVGGLVGDRLGFADGGMVGTTSGGTPVHLHLDGQQFVMSAADHVASALVTVSQRYQMRSAGVKPSWYGGRPGG